MNQIYRKARAKVNLTLEVLEKREDNYHNLKSVFQKINLYDEMYIMKTNRNDLELESNIANLRKEDNIIYKAYRKLKERFKEISGVKVRLIKKIPMQAGLAGGSTDCASFLLGINKLFELHLSKKELIELGSSLGADVVPCMYNKAVLAEGIGDRITNIKTSFKYYIVIVKPNFSCNTGEMYQKLDEKERNLKTENSESVIKALENDDIQLLSNHLFNSFEAVVDVKRIKEELIENKALGALLSGSGSCVFGIFRNKEEAKLAYRVLKKKYEAYLCFSYNSSKEEIL